MNYGFDWRSALYDRVDMIPWLPLVSLIAAVPSIIVALGPLVVSAGPSIELRLPTPLFITVAPGWTSALPIRLGALVEGA